MLFLANIVKLHTGIAKAVMCCCCSGQHYVKQFKLNVFCMRDTSVGFINTNTKYQNKYVVWIYT